MSRTTHNPFFLAVQMLLILLCTLTFISCQSNNAAKSNVVLINQFDSSITDEKEILGTWSMCASSSGGVMTQYNVCPTIVFNADGTGRINMYHFRWTFKKGFLNIINPDKTEGWLSSGRAYFAGVNEESKLLKFIITQGDGEAYLSKQIY